MTSGPRSSYTPQFVAPPPTVIYRVAGTRRLLAGAPFNPFNPAPWGSLFKGRFDDPRIGYGKNTGSCFRVVYCASQSSRWRSAVALMRAAFVSQNRRH